MRVVFLLLIGIFFLGTIQAQQVSGTIRDNSGRALPGTTITLKKTRDSSVIKLAVTDKSGKYAFENIPVGRYFITASEIGFAPAATAPFRISDQKTVSLPDLVLNESASSLKGITVTYNKPLIEVRADKMILNVAGSVNDVGQNALDLLRKSPGVMVDKDNNLSLSGKNGVQVYVDGRPVPLSGTDLAEYLKTIQSSDIQSIEIISNPSAKYDAAGNAGIINIRLKKNSSYGLNGTVNAGYDIGIYSKYNGGFTLNFRQNKFNLYGNYNYNQGINQTYMNLYRVQLDTLFNNHSTINTTQQSHNFRAGLDYYLNSKNTIGIMVNGTLSNSNIMTGSSTPISFIPDSKTDRVLVADNNSSSYRNNANLNLNYHFGDTLGHTLDMDANYGIFWISSNQLQPNAYYDSTLSTLLYSDNYDLISPTVIKIYNIKADYEENFAKGKLGFGGKISYVNSDNDFKQYNVYPQGKTLDTLSSNHFIYTENINAVYGNYNRTLKGWVIQAGLRIENSNISGISNGFSPGSSGYTAYDSGFHRHYTDFFPSGALTYNKNPMKQWTLTYSRRIDRPAYQDLNPFEFRLDEYTYQKGNTQLKPQYTNSIGLTYMFKYFLTTTLNYSHVRNVFTQLVDTTDRSKAFLTKDNLATQDITSLNISAPFSYKHYSAFMNLNTYYSIYEANFGTGRTINLNVFAFNAYLQQTYRLNNGWSAELSGFYTTPTIWQGTFKTQSIWSMDLGIQKTVMHKKGLIKVSVSDLFNTLHWTATSNFAGQYLHVNGGYESRELKLYFSYRFGNSKVKPSQQHKTGDEEETKRVGSQGGSLNMKN